MQPPLAKSCKIIPTRNPTVSALKGLVHVVEESQHVGLVDEEPQPPIAPPNPDLMDTCPLLDGTQLAAEMAWELPETQPLDDFPGQPPLHRTSRAVTKDGEELEQVMADQVAPEPVEPELVEEPPKISSPEAEIAEPFQPEDPIPPAQPDLPEEPEVEVEVSPHKDTVVGQKINAVFFNDEVQVKAPLKFT